MGRVLVFGIRVFAVSTVFAVFVLGIRYRKFLVRFSIPKSEYFVISTQVSGPLGDTWSTILLSDQSSWLVRTSNYRNHANVYVVFSSSLLSLIAILN